MLRRKGGSAVDFLNALWQLIFMKKKNAAKRFGIVLFSCLLFTACSKDGNREDTEGSDLKNPVNTPDVSSPSAAPNIKDDSKNSSAPVVSYEIVREARTDESGRELVYAEYPVFTVTGDDYSALSTAADQLNEEWKGKNKEFLDEMETNAKEWGEISWVYGRDTSVTITRCDADIVCIMILRTEEQGGTHPNNYTDSYNFNAKTGEQLKLSDVITVDEQQKEAIVEELYKNYSEFEFDDALVKQEVSSMLDANTVNWYFWEGNIQIVFPEGSFGFSHAEGSLGVLIPVQP